MLWEERHKPYTPNKPFAEWLEVEESVFKGLILRLVNLDLTKRITAQQALEHLWFKDDEESMNL
jgi:hypothetical protein